MPACAGMTVKYPSSPAHRPSNKARGLLAPRPQRRVQRATGEDPQSEQSRRRLLVLRMPGFDPEAALAPRHRFNLFSDFAAMELDASKPW
jgi:hypothetical protein